MVRYAWIVPVLLAFPAFGCGGVKDPNLEEAERDTLEQVGEARQALIRYCVDALDCNAPAGCECDTASGQCQPNGFGSPEGDTCSLPPQRACATSANCRSGCDCTGGYCQEDVFGPPREGNYCARPLPDAYEDDNVSQSAQGYLGSPQTGHTFHDLGDEDWVVVYFPTAAQATFETYDLVGDADTVMSLYAYDASTSAPGSLLAESDDQCAVYYNPVCKASKILRSVPAQSAFFVRIRNQSSAGHNVYNSTAPGYSLKIY